MIILSLILMVCAFLFAYEETQEWLGTRWGDIREHIASIAHRFSLIAFGYCFARYGKLIETPYYLGLYWLLCDGLMNLMKKRKFLAVSGQSGNPFEKWDVVKFSLIIIGIILIAVKGL